MEAARKGRQTPTQSVTLPYTKTHGKEAVDLYNRTGRIAQKWQGTAPEEGFPLLLSF